MSDDDKSPVARQMVRTILQVPLKRDSESNQRLWRMFHEVGAFVSLGSFQTLGIGEEAKTLMYVRSCWIEKEPDPEADVAVWIIGLEGSVRGYDSARDLAGASLEQVIVDDPLKH